MQWSSFDLLLDYYYFLNPDIRLLPLITFEMSYVNDTVTEI